MGGLELHVYESSNPFFMTGRLKHFHQRHNTNIAPQDRPIQWEIHSFFMGKKTRDATVLYAIG